VSRRGIGYERLDRDYLEPVEVPPSPHHDDGLGTQAPAAALQQIEVDLQAGVTGLGGMRSPVSDSR